MPRTADPALRDELLAGVLEHVLARGLSGLSLRPLGRTLHVSPRTILYHFGSKNALLDTIFDEARTRQRALLEGWIARSAEYELATLLLGAWRWLSAPRHEPILRLAFETAAAGLQQRKRYGAVGSGAIDDWLAFFRRILETGGLSGDRAATLATILVAFTRGLLLDLLATGERARVDRAFRSFITAIELPALD
ncbi:MAG: TetR/AcrR family transcriptional regulator [Candidatus Baltobacteraceae bacterium]